MDDARHLCGLIGSLRLHFAPLHLCLAVVPGTAARLGGKALYTSGWVNERWMDEFIIGKREEGG